MGFLESILVKIGSHVASVVWASIEKRLEEYFETKSQIKGIAKEAEALKDELTNATTDAERFQILHKISQFQDRIGN